MTTDPLAYAWTLSTIGGLFIGGRAIRRSLRRLRHLDAAKEEGIELPDEDFLRDTALGHLRREAVRSSVQLALFGIGLGAILEVEWILSLVGPVLVLVQWAVVANSWLDDRNAQRLAAGIEQVELNTAKKLMRDHVAEQRRTDEQ